jgi:hypothetical protein
MVASAQSDLLGKWIFASSNHVIPEKCTHSYLDFVSPSRIKGSDGSRSVTVAYSAEKIEAGYNLITEKIDDDGKPDCRGVLKEEPGPVAKSSASSLCPCPGTNNICGFIFPGNVISFIRKKIPSALNRMLLFRKGCPRLGRNNRLSFYL